MLPHFCRRIEAAMLTSKPCALVSQASAMLAERERPCRQIITRLSPVPCRTAAASG